MPKIGIVLKQSSNWQYNNNIIKKSMKIRLSMAIKLMISFSIRRVNHCATYILTPMLIQGHWVTSLRTDFTRHLSRHYTSNISVCSGVRTFVPTDIRSHAIFDRADIRAHIKWPPRTFVLTSNDQPGHSCSHQITTPDIRAHIKLPPGHSFTWLFSSLM